MPPAKSSASGNSTWITLGGRFATRSILIIVPAAILLGREHFVGRTFNANWEFASVAAIDSACARDLDQGV